MLRLPLIERAAVNMKNFKSLMWKKKKYKENDMKCRKKKYKKRFFFVGREKKNLF